MSWATFKTALETLIQNQATTGQFAVTSVTREDGSVVTYESFDKVLKAYKAVCALASQETLGRTSRYRPVTLRKGTFRV